MGDRLFLRGKTWWCWGYGIDGKRWQESTKQRERRAAELAAREITRRYAANPDRARASKISLERALNDLLHSMQRAGRAEATVRAAGYHGGHLVRLLGRNTPITSVGLATASDYLAKRLAEDRKSSRHTVAKELRTLQQAWRRLAKLGQLPPCPPLIPDELGTVYTPRDRWLTREEYEQLRAELAPKRAGAKGGLRHHTQDRRDYLAAYVLTGMRKAELFAYDRARDLNVERSELRVRGTKTDEADRLVPLTPEVLELFQRRASFPEWHTIVRDLERACDRAGIPPVTTNDLRRTFCSWLCQAGVPERVCADLMGHASTVMVRSVYGHLDRRTLAQAVSHLSTRPVAEVVAAESTKLPTTPNETAVKEPAKQRAKRGKLGTPGKI